MTSLVNSATWSIGTGAGTFTLSFDAGSSANRVLHVFIFETGTATPSAVTYNGTSLHQNQAGDDYEFELIAPASGSNTLSVTYSAANSSTHLALIVSVDGVNQDFPTYFSTVSRNPASAAGVSTSPFTASSSQTCLDVALVNNTGSCTPNDAGVTTISPLVVGSFQLIASHRQGAGAAFNGTWTLPGGATAPFRTIIYRNFGDTLGSGWFALTANKFQESGANSNIGATTATLSNQNLWPVSSTTPTMSKVVGNNGVTSVGMDASGNLYTWGSDNGTGMLGDGTAHAAGSGEIAVPTKVSGVSNVVDIALARLTTFFAKSDGTVWYFGQDITTGTNHTSATQVSSLSSITRIAAAAGTLLALDSANKLWFVGDNTEGQAGNGAHTGTVSTPYNMLSSVSDFAMSEFHCVAVSGGTAYCWGSNQSNCTGQGVTTGFTTTPTAVSGPSSVTKVAALDSPCTIALTNSNLVYHWGDGSSGEGGDGTFGTNYGPHSITMPAGPTYMALAPNAFSFEVYVLTSTGGVVGWGLNPFGSIARNGFSAVGSPVTIYPSLLTGITSLCDVGDDGYIFLLGAKARAFVYCVG